MAWLKWHHPGQRVYLLGNRALRQEFEAAGIALDEDSPDVVVTTFDTELTYQKLCLVCDFVRVGLPTASSTGRQPDKIIGKPNAEMMDYLLEQTGVGRQETAMVGDRLYTDDLFTRIV